MNTTEQYIVICPRIGDKTDFEKDGKVLRLAENYEKVLESVTLKFGLEGNDVKLSSPDGKAISSIDELKATPNVVVETVTPLIRDIPGPKPKPFVGNLLEVARGDRIANFKRLFAEYGPVMKLKLGANTIYMTNDPEIAKVLTKESDYVTKHIVPGSGLGEIKDVAGDGLFTTDTSEHIWQLAHKLLIPAFSPRALQAYSGEMQNIANRCANAFGEMADKDETANINHWTTNIALETIGNCAFGYEFGLFEKVAGQDGKQQWAESEFATGLAFCLIEALNRSRSAQFWKALPTSANYQFASYKRFMQETVQDILKTRKENPHAAGQQRDLLDFMLEARDKSTDEGLPDRAIVDNSITFLIAGHETTAATMAFFYSFISKHPEVEKKLLQELVNIGIDPSGDKVPTNSQLNELKYLDATIRETLRCYGPIPGFAKFTKKETTLPGGFVIPANSSIVVHGAGLHSNPKYWDEPEKFDPDRFMPGKVEKLHPYQWLPFSTGARGCIGRMFAMLEMKIVLSRLLLGYHIETLNELEPDFRGLTIKPKELMVRITRRKSLPEPSTEVSAVSESRSTEVPPSPANVNHIVKAIPGAQVDLPILYTFYGTNTGTSNEIASRAQAHLVQLGFKDGGLHDLDDYDSVVKSGNKAAVFICTSTYNGEPPDNAEKFSRYLDFAASDEFKNIDLAVFGCGNRQWNRTFQAFPTRVREIMEKKGARRLAEAGVGDAAADIDADWRAWAVRALTALVDIYQIPHESSGQKDILTEPYVNMTDGVKVKFLPLSDVDLSTQAKANTNGELNGILLQVKELQNVEMSGRSTKDIQIQLPDDMSYEVGDHLEVYPQNASGLVEQVALRLGLILDASFHVQKTDNPRLSKKSLANVITGPCTVRNALTYYADLSGPPTRYLIAALANKVKDEDPKAYEELHSIAMSEDKAIFDEFLRTHRNVSMVLNAYPMVKGLSIVEFLTTIQAMAPRRYSIASSPLVEPHVAALVVGVSHVSVGGEKFYGMCSGFLGKAEPGTKVRVSTKSSRGFLPPTDPTVPVVYICAGTGIAPFMGFLQHRQKQGIKGPSTLIFGCRHPDYDHIYKKQIDAYLADGTLSAVYIAFSRHTSPYRYVQHAMMQHASELWSQRKDMRVYMCGSASGMATDVKDTIRLLAQQLGGKSPELSNELLGSWFASDKFMEDTWG